MEKQPFYKCLFWQAQVLNLGKKEIQNVKTKIIGCCLFGVCLSNVRLNKYITIQGNKRNKTLSADEWRLIFFVTNEANQIF